MSDSKLKNEDFRKLLASSSTTKVNNNSTSKTTTNSVSHAFTHRRIGNSAQAKTKPKKYIPPRSDHVPKVDDDIFDESEARLVEILKNYRDRASERRRGMFSDETEISKLIRASKDSKIGGSVLDTSITESRKLQIQKSKYLGGDMAHTHLVKGLDYSLLNKVRTEIHDRQVTEKEKALNDPIVITSDPTQIGNKLARNICKILFETKLAQRNELFVRGRMAYLVELDEEESDVPSTLMRSVIESSVDQSIESINADNVLINKLSQVLVYLRTDIKKKKKSGFERDNVPNQESINIFEGLDDYVSSNKDEKRNGDERRRQKDGETLNQKKSYFSNSESESRSRGRDDRNGQKDNRRAERKRERDEEAEKREKDKLEKEILDKEENLQKKRRKLEQEDAYAEFYPGGMGMMDAGGESDDDDFTQMDQVYLKFSRLYLFKLSELDDINIFNLIKIKKEYFKILNFPQGNRKSQIKRWDFDTQEDYERYQNQREAHPRAVYQFGVKTSGGRKTRKNVSAVNDKKIDRELDKINKILERGTSQNVRY